MRCMHRARDASVRRRPARGPLTLRRPADPEDPYRTTDATRTLGLVVCRGNTVLMVCPEDGFTEIENPFAGAGAA